MNKKIIIDIEEFESINELSLDDQELFKKATDATSLSYAPYSQFHVGAAIRLNNNEIVLGANQENASYSATICAERVALSAISSSHPKQTIKAIAVTYRSNGVNQSTLSPCGICRQSLLEHEDRIKQPIKVILGSRSGKIVIFKSVADTLPLHFTGSNLF